MEDVRAFSLDVHDELLLSTITIHIVGIDIPREVIIPCDWNSQAALEEAVKAFLVFEQVL